MADTLPINDIVIFDNYRKTFDEKKLREMENSIKENGVIEPLIVRLKANQYELVAGERRLRAATNAGLVEVPVVIMRNMTDEKFYELQLIENIQREGVNVIEEARGIKRLQDKCMMTVEEISKKIGKKDSTVYNYLSLLKMHPAAIEATERGWITRTAAVKIARLKLPDDQEKAALALRRKDKLKLVSDRFTRQYIQDNFGERRVKKPQRNAIQKQNGNDYNANWKKYLLRFTAEQFEAFKIKCNGDTATSTFAEAVETVMLVSESRATAA